MRFTIRVAPECVSVVADPIKETRESVICDFFITTCVYGLRTNRHEILMANLSFEFDLNAYSQLRSMWKYISLKDSVQGKPQVQFDVLFFQQLKGIEAIRVDSLFAVYQLNQSEQF